LAKHSVYFGSHRLGESLQYFPCYVLVSTRNFLFRNFGGLGLTVSKNSDEEYAQKA